MKQLAAATLIICLWATPLATQPRACEPTTKQQVMVKKPKTQKWETRIITRGGVVTTKFYERRLKGDSRSVSR